MKLLISLLVGVYGCSFSREQSVRPYWLTQYTSVKLLNFQAWKFQPTSMPSFEEPSEKLLIQNGHSISESCAKDQENCKDDVNDGFYSTIEECLEEMASDCLHQEL